MKSLQEFRQAYSSILAYPEKRDKKQLRRDRQTAGRLREAIRWTELGVDEAFLKKQVAQLKERMRIFDGRWSEAECSLEVWRKRNGYAEMKRNIARMNWVLKY